MKSKLTLLISLPLVMLAAACGSSNNDNNGAVTTTSAVTSCNSGQVYYNNGCYTPTYGQPGSGSYTPVSGVTIPPGNYCNGGYGYGYGGGCFNRGYSYNYGMSGGYLYIW